MAESLKQKTATGLFWGALNSGTTQVLNLVIGIFLARLLTPEDYGIIGVLTIFTAIAGDLQSAGYTHALINMKNPTKREYNSVFTFNVVVSSCIYVILFLCAPFIADFFNQECLVDVSRFVFLGFLISSFGIVHMGYMMKKMMNKEMAEIGFVSLVISGTVGILLALEGYGYWALAWNQIIFILINSLGKYFFVKEWTPRLTLDMEPVIKMTPFAVKILVTRVVNTVSSNVLTVLFGRLFPVRMLGNYTQAFKWSNMAQMLVVNNISQVALTVLSESKSDTNGEEDTNRQLRVFRKMVRMTCFFSMPIMFGLCLVANEFITLSIGAKWSDSVLLLQIFCVSGAFVPLYTMYQNLVLSHKRSDLYLWLTVFQILIQFTIILLLYKYGMVLMVTVYSLLLLIWLLPWHFFANSIIGYRWFDMIKDVMPFALAAAMVMLLTHVLTCWIDSLVITFCMRIVLAAALYYLVMKVAKVQILLDCEAFVRSKMGN